MSRRSKAARQSSALVSTNNLDGGPPELVTQMSRRPKRSSTAAKKRETAAAFVTSTAWWKNSRPVDLRIRAAACSRSGALRAQTATLAPSRASSSATARPSPLLAAATMATRPCSPRSRFSPRSKLPWSRESRGGSNRPDCWIAGREPFSGFGAPQQSGYRTLVACREKLQGRPSRTLLLHHHSPTIVDLVAHRFLSAWRNLHKELHGAAI